MSEQTIGIITELDIVSAYKKGQEAAWKAVSRGFNPFPTNLPRWIIWNAGYDDAINVMLVIARRVS